MHSKDVVICNAYRPPSGNTEKDICYLDDCVKSLDLGKVELFILGDLNIDYQKKHYREL